MDWETIKMSGAYEEAAHAVHAIEKCGLEVVSVEVEPDEYCHVRGNVWPWDAIEQSLVGNRAAWWYRHNAAKVIEPFEAFEENAEASIEETEEDDDYPDDAVVLLALRELCDSSESMGMIYHGYCVSAEHFLQSSWPEIQALAEELYRHDHLSGERVKATAGANREENPD